MKKEQIILIGGGGHCKSCIDVIEAEGKYQIAGIVDVPERIGQKILGYEIIASDEMIPELSKEYINFFITIGQIKPNRLRKNIVSVLEQYHVNFPVIISPTAVVSNRAQIGEGTIVMHQAVVNTNAVIGRHNIINTAAIVEHDVKSGDFCHISINATIGGSAKIGDNCFIGGGAFLFNNILLMNDIVVGAGSVVNRSYNENGILLKGNPAKSIKY
ncbi:MAG: acetyltransferase [Marinilabiliales bacterium]